MKRATYETEKLAQAIFTVNRHAKTALQPQHLYTIKKMAIEKLLKEKRAQKIGLHFAKSPKYSNQYSTLLVRVGQYYFHVPPSKKDFKQLKHLGDLDEQYRNPKAKMNLNHAKKIIYNYINWKEKRHEQQKGISPYYIPSSLGKMEWPPTKKFY